MKRALEYVAFLLIGALIMAAAIASASYVTGIRGGWRPFSIFTEPDEKVAGAGPIFTAEGDVVENRCYFVPVPGEGILYYDSQNPDTTACVHPQGAPADVSPDAVPGRGAPERLPIHYRQPYPTSSEPRIAQSRMRFAMEVATRNPRRSEPSLTLTHTQCTAIPGNRENKKPLIYAGFANLCNAEQPLTAHS